MGVPAVPWEGVMSGADLRLAATGAMQLGLVCLTGAILLLTVGNRSDSWYAAPALVCGYAALGAPALLLLYMLMLDYRAMKQGGDRSGRVR